MLISFNTGTTQCSISNSSSSSPVSRNALTCSRGGVGNTVNGSSNSGLCKLLHREKGYSHVCGAACNCAGLRCGYKACLLGPSLGMMLPCKQRCPLTGKNCDKWPGLQLGSAYKSKTSVVGFFEEIILWCAGQRSEQSQYCQQKQPYQLCFTFITASCNPRKLAC